MSWRSVEEEDVFPSCLYYECPKELSIIVHSGIKYLTPNQRHYSKPDAICAILQQTYAEARAVHPQRWSRPPRDWSQPQIVQINHPRPQKPLAA